jgi:beta-glucosidase
MGEESPAAEAFLWGVATSAYQSEGGYNGPGGPRTNWAVAEERGDVTPVGNAADFWTRYAEDFERARKLGLNAFRLGIEWSRIQPSSETSSAAPPPFDLRALDHYADMLTACRSNGLEPILTLHHFVHPAWLGPDAWLAAETAPLFVRYVLTSLRYLNARLLGDGRPIRFIITINEPNMLVLNTYFGKQFPSGTSGGLAKVMQAYEQLLRAHVLAYNAIHDLYLEEGWPAPAVTLNNYCSDVYWSDKVWLDLLSLRCAAVSRGDICDHILAKARAFDEDFAAARVPLHRDLPYYFGTLVKWISTRLARYFFDPTSLKGLLDAIYESKRERLFDLVGLDYYDPFAAHVFRLPVWWDHDFKNKSVRAWLMNSITSKWWDWRVLPRGLHFFCEEYYKEYGLPLLIAENGLAVRRRRGEPHKPRRDRITRSQFLRLHIHEINRIRANGLPLIGYLHWSLFDNYEWGTYSPRFGLFSIDYDKGSDRIARDADGDEPSATYARLIVESRLGEPPHS